MEIIVENGLIVILDNKNLLQPQYISMNDPVPQDTTYVYMYCIYNNIVNLFIFL